MTYLASSKTIKSLFATVLASMALLSASLSLAEPVLRVSAIPDESPTELQRKFKPLGEYLEKKLGMKVVFTPVTDYAASVEGLINNKLDLVWFGGFTFIQAKVRSNNQVIPLVQREEDEKFKSVFITTHNDITKLQDLKGPPDATFLSAGRQRQSGNRHEAHRLFRRA
jgi:phosphonate transport system substrate-binding protein